MISHQESVLVKNLVNSEAFGSIIESIKRDLFEEWSGEGSKPERDDIYYEMLALDRLVENIITKAQESISGDTNA